MKGQVTDKRSGPSCDQRPSSLREDIAGVFAVTSFLGAAQRFVDFQLTILCVTFVPDSEILILRMND